MRTLDCARKLRIRYVLPQPVDESLLACFPECEVDLQRFSQFVAGARDQFTLRCGNRMRIAGVIGDTLLTATFGKAADGSEAEAAVAALEAVLADAFGPVHTVESA